MTFKEYSHSKIIHPEHLTAKVYEMRNKNQTVATLNGSFDLMHAGHLHIIYEASTLADILIVALNSDSSVKGYKDASRPFIPLVHRLEMMTALAFVDFVAWFDELDPCTLLARIKPDVHVNGAEYGQDCVEAPVVRAYGGKLHLVERIPGLATSLIIQKIRAS